MFFRFWGIIFLFLSFTIYSQTIDPFAHSVNATVQDLVSTDEYTYICGDFTIAGRYSSINKCRTDKYELRGNFPRINGSVNSIISDGAGGWYVGGFFTTVNDQTKNYLVRINSDGSINSTWNPVVNNYVNCMVFDGTNVFIGGAFTTVSGFSRNMIAKINGTTGAVITDWSHSVTGTTIKTMWKDGSVLYFGGAFTQVDGSARGNIAKVYTDNNTLDGWNLSFNDQVNSIAGSGTDIYVGGYFSTVNGTTRNGLAKLSTNNSNVEPTWDPNANSYVSTVAINGADIFVGGAFNTLGGSSIQYLAKLNNSTGEFDAGWNPSPDNYVKAITITGSNMFIGGDFTTISGSAHNKIAKLVLSNGNIDNNWYYFSQGSVYTIYINGTDLICGSDLNFFGLNRNRAARFNNVTGEVDSLWNPKLSASCFKIAVDGSDIYLGGGFRTVNGSLSKDYIARVNNTTGALDVGWTAYTNGSVYSIEVDVNSIYVGGTFSTANNIARVKLAKFNKTTGTLDGTWIPSVNNTVSSILLADNSLYIGGSFTSPKNRMAKLNLTTGAADPTWSPNISDGTVYQAYSNDGSIYALGSFTKVNGSSTANRNKIAKFNNTNGIMDADWNPNLNNDAYRSFFYNGSMYVVGSFTGVGSPSTTVSRFAKLNSNGTLNDYSLGTFNNYINRISKSGNYINVGGPFTTVDSKYTGYFARFYDGALPVELISFTSNVVNNTVYINWQTATEINNYGFEIQKALLKNSETNGEFVTIGFVEGAGNSNAVKNYSFTDKSTNQGKYAYRLKQIDIDGKFTYSNSIQVDVNNMPSNYELSQNYPNPFNPSTTISFSLPVSNFVTLKIYDILGNEITTLVNEQLKAGNHIYEFNASNLSSGVYFYRLQYQGNSIVKKMQLLK